MAFPHFIIPKAGLLRTDHLSKISEQAGLPCVPGQIRTIAFCLRRWRPWRTQWRVAKVGFGGLIEEFRSRTSVCMPPGSSFFSSLSGFNPFLRDSKKSQNTLLVFAALWHCTRILLMLIEGRCSRGIGSLKSLVARSPQAQTSALPRPFSAALLCNSYLMYSSIFRIS